MSILAANYVYFAQQVLHQLIFLAPLKSLTNLYSCRMILDRGLMFVGFFFKSWLALILNSLSRF